MWLPDAGFANLVCCSRSRRGRNGAGLRKGRSRRRKTLKPLGCLPRRNKRMSGISGALPLPLAGGQERAKGKVDYRNTEEGLLVRRVQKGDEMAFRDVVERYQSKVFSIIYGILRNHNDAEDIAQQVFAKIYFSIGNFDFRSSLLTWIYKITVNECYDYLRKKRVRKLVYESDFSDEDSLRLAHVETAADSRPSIENDLARRD